MKRSNNVSRTFIARFARTHPVVTGLIIILGTILFAFLLLLAVTRWGFRAEIDWLGYTQSFLASISVALGFFIIAALQDSVRSFIQRTLSNKEVFVKLPAMTAVAPLIQGIRAGLWWNEEYVLRLDWSYSGRSALLALEQEVKGMSDDALKIVVATDYSICRLLGNQGNVGKYWVFPFALIQNPVREIHLASDDSSSIKTYAFQAESIQEDYLAAKAGVLDLELAEDERAERLAEFHRLKGNSITNTHQAMEKVMLHEDGALLVWEPFEAVFATLENLEIEPPAHDYHSVLCLVMERGDILEPDALKIANVMRDACKETQQNVHRIRSDIKDYFPDDFIGEYESDEMATSGAGTSYSFELEAVQRAFIERLHVWRKVDLSTVNVGAAQLLARASDNELWPRLPTKHLVSS